MGRPCACRCSVEDCDCKTLTLLKWAGDRDFSGDLDIRNYAGVTQSILTRQKPNTSMLWRIRYDPDDEFLEYLTDTRTLVAGSVLNGTAFIDYLPFSNAAAILSGPLRDGIMYGLDTVPTSYTVNTYRQPGPLPYVHQDPFTASADPVFIGTSDLKVYNTNGSPDPGNWTLEDHPDNPIEIPWVLELGCSRCADSSMVSWPDHTNWHYDPWVPYGGVGGGYVATDPDSSTLIATPVSGACQAITPDDLQSIYWPGDEAESDHESLCPPDCVVWVSDLNANNDIRVGNVGGIRSIPGKSYGVDVPTHPAVQLASSAGRVALFAGWTGRISGLDVARALRGDSATVGNVDVVWLTNPYHTSQSLQISTYSYSMSASDTQWIVDWLALGGKTLIVDTPWKHLTIGPTGSGNNPITDANTFLGWVGSSLSIYSINDATKYVYALECVSTETHPLAPSPETLFTGIQDNIATFINVGGEGGHLSIPPKGITGGTALYRYDCTMRPVGQTGSFSESHPCIAVEEQANGSRIVTGSISINQQTFADTEMGLANVPAIGNLIARVISTA